MKILLPVAYFFIVSIVYAQKPIEKTVGEFSTLKVYDLIQVELIKSNENKIVISGNNKNDVVVNNKNGTLKIKMHIEEAFDGSDTKVKLYYTNLDIIDGNEGAKIFSNAVIEQFEVDLNAQEGAELKLKVNVKYLNVRAVTGGNVYTYGTAEHQDISIYTGGDYHGEDLITQYTNVSIRAAGEAYVKATKKVDAKVRAGGDIFIYGNPAEVNESKVLGGRIKRM